MNKYNKILCNNEFNLLRENNIMINNAIHYNILSEFNGLIITSKIKLIESKNI